MLCLFAGASGASITDYTGTLYLSKSASAVGSGNWQVVTSAPSGVDNLTQNRVNSMPPSATAVTGYAAFAPGLGPGLGNSAVSASATASVCKGWIVDGSGGMAFSAGTWTVNATVEDPLFSSGQARLAAALYKVDSNGNVTSTVASPTDGPTDLVRSSGAVTTTETISLSGSAVSLSASDHLCLMFWRHQTTTYTSSSGSGRLLKLDINDGTARISAHPAPNGFPTSTLSGGPANGAYVKNGDVLTLGATYGDPESAAGTVVIQACSDSACSSVQSSQTFNAVSAGSTVTWNPTLADGTWYWRASSNDGTTTVWTSTQSFILNTTVPNVPALVTPTSGTTTNSLGLSATFSDPAVADTGTVNFQLCSDALCTSTVASGSSSSVSNGANGTWTISPAPADGLYYWRAQAVDLAGNASSFSATRTVTFDRTAPTTTITGGPGTYALSGNASFSFNPSETATFECNLDGAGWGTACSSPKSYSGLADGSHTFQVRATDTVGNVGAAASSSWTIDTTVPSTPVLSTPANAALMNTIPSFGATFSDPTAGDAGTVQFRICTSSAGVGVQCSGLITSGSSSSVSSGSSATWAPASLSDGTYNWQARSQDTAGNVSGWSATRSFTYDATPPDTTIDANPPSQSNSAAASFSFSSTESGSFSCSLDGAAFTPCTSAQSYTGLSEASHTFSVKATDAAGNTDPSPATYTWTVDLTAPDTTIGPTMPPAVNPSSSATFDLGATESSTFECNLDGGGWSACTTPKTYTSLSEANHTFQVRATDSAGNVDATPASRTWFADTTVPSTAPAAPADGGWVTTTPQLQATFTDPTSSDTGTVDFRLCSSAATAGTACGSVVQSSTSASVASGAKASFTPASIADGQYYWQTRGQDAAGNLSAWTATSSFLLDTTPPIVPTLVSPADGVWTNKSEFQATYADSAFGSSGTVEFRLCSDALCLATVRTGFSATVPRNSKAAFTPNGVGDGLLWWQARAHDAAGNVSAWSPARSVNLDQTPPAAPKNFNGQIAGDGLTLRWDPPVDSVANFVVYVDGASLPWLGEKTYEFKAGPFDAGDTREFSVLAVDRAGNVGAMSPVLVGVPNLLGLTFAQAQDAASTRGLVIRRGAASVKTAGAAGVVVAQSPAPAALANKGSAVDVVVKTPTGGTALTLVASPNRVVCAPGSSLKLRVTMSRTAMARARILSARGRVVGMRDLGLLHAGANTVRVHLPRTLRGGIRVVVEAPNGGATAHAVVRVKQGTRACRAQ